MTDAAVRRTPERPMAFGAWEFVRGALLTYLYWIVLYVPAVVLTSILQVARDAALSAAGDFTGTFTTADRGTIDIGDFGANAYWAIVDAPAMAIWLLPYAGPASGIALLSFGWALALLAGLLLRRTAARWPHLLAHLAVGMLVGAVTPFLTLFVMFGPNLYLQPNGLPFTLELGWSYAVVFGLTTGIAAMLGWLTTSRMALGKDRRTAAAAMS